MRTLIIIITLILLSGCGSNPTTEITIHPFELGHPTPLTLTPIHGKLIYVDDKPYVSLTTDEFESLVENNKKIENYVRECVIIIDETEQYYQKYIKHE